MNHYCTYFDRGFLIQGLALWRSLTKHDDKATLWVLALDDFTAALLRALAEERLQVVTLAELETDDSVLLEAKAGRSRIEYYFTLSPCWPHWLLQHQPEIGRITYLDADMLFFAAPEPVFAAMDTAGASILMTGHRFPDWLRHYEANGRFNIGILSFRNDQNGRACLDDWRKRCLEWCYDRYEDGKFGDQKYLDDWPARFGPALLVLEHAGVNLAPWNWLTHRVEWMNAEQPERDNAVQRLRFDGQPLILFHFSRFRPLLGDWWWQSGQLNYGVMPWRMRQTIYGGYWRALKAARSEIAARRPGFDLPRASIRLDRESWRLTVMGVLFGAYWLRLGERFVSGRLGLGRWSGRIVVWLLKYRSESSQEMA